jgi:regulatory protein
MANPAYIAGLKLLARRELSEAQVRLRLARRDYAPEDIDEAIATLRESHALDDARVAAAIAHTETSIKRRGKLRVRRKIEQAGISPALAARAVDEVFHDLDPDALIEAALDRRLHGRPEIGDDRQFQRLYRFLISQGFEPDRILRTLLARRRRPGTNRE